MGGDGHSYLPRLAKEFYQGDAVVHWTLTIHERKIGWMSTEFHLRFREIVLHVSAREGLFCPVYCLMPDHMHLVWMGLRADSDQRIGMAFLRTHLRAHLKPFRFQLQPQDHVLREEERKRNLFARTCGYILENPFKASLIERGKEWPFCGAVVPGYPTLHPLGADYWEKFWRIYNSAREPDSRRVLPPRTTRTSRRAEEEQ